MKKSPPQPEPVNVNIFSNAVKTLKGDLDRKEYDKLGNHLDQLGTLIAACTGAVMVLWPNDHYKDRQGTVGNTGCDKRRNK